MTTIPDIIKAAQQFGVFGLVIAILWGGHKGIWVWKRDCDATVARVEKELERVIKDRDSETARIKEAADAEVKRVSEERERERERAQRYEDYTLRLLETARQATAVATDAVTKRGGGP